MKKILIAMMIAAPAMGQMAMTEDGDWHFVPEGKQIVFIPKDLPQQCHVICKAEVMYPGVVNPTLPEGDCCPIGDLCVSPSVQCKD